MSTEQDNSNEVTLEQTTEPDIADDGGATAATLEDGDCDPLEWSAYYDADGRIYYYNSTTTESSWEAPDKFNPPPPQELVNAGEEEGQFTANGADDPQQEEEEEEETASPKQEEEQDPAAWVKYEDDEGREYFYNSVTGETQWDKPEDYVDEDSRHEAVATDVSPKETGERAEEQEEKAENIEKVNEEEEEEEEIDPQVKLLEDAEKALKRPDAVMEPDCLTHVHQLLSSHGPSVGAQKATQSLIDSYTGDTAICGLLGLWLADIKSSVSSTEGVQKKDSFNSAADEVRDVAQNIVNKIAKERFTKSGGDDILHLSKAEAKFLEDMIDSERWRKLLIDLSAAHKDSALLMYCLQSISKRGHHREIAKRVNQSDHFSVYNAMLASEFATVATAASSVGSNAPDSSIGIDELVKDLRRTCTSTSYTYLYAIELLRALVSGAESKASSDTGGSHRLQGFIRKWNRLREELEGSMVDPSFSSGASTLFRKRRLDLALTMSDLHQRQRRRQEPGTEKDEKNDHRRDRLEACLLKLLRKQSMGSPLDDGLLDQLLRSEGDSGDGMIGKLMIQYPLTVKTLLGHLFKPGASRTSSMVTRNKCARLIALSVVSAKDAVLEQGPVTPNTGEEDESEAEGITRMLLTASQLCELLENMVGFTVSRDDKIGDDASAGAKLCALSLKNATIAQGVIVWAAEITHNPEFVTSPPYPTLSPSILSLVRIISERHPFTRRAVLDVALVFLRHSNSEISYQTMNDLKEQSLRLLLFLLAQGEVTSVLDSITTRLREQGKSEIDASLIRYFVGGVLEVIRPPFSLSLVQPLGAMLTAPRCVDALRSSYFGADKKTQLVQVIDNLNDAVKTDGKVADDAQLVSTLQTILRS